MARQPLGSSVKKYAERILQRGLSVINGVDKRHTVLTGGIIAGLAIIGVFSFAGWQYWQQRELRVAQRVLDSTFENVHVESNTYQNAYLQGYVAYPLTENAVINDNIRRVANAYFLPCKDAGLKSQVPQPLECNAAFEVDIATDDYIGITYTFRQYAQARADTRKKVSLLFDRHSGRQLAIGDLFKPNTPFLDTLSRLSRASLTAQVGNKINANQQLSDSITNITQPQAANFANFAFNEEEKLVITYNDIVPELPGMVSVALPSDKLYAFFDPKIIKAFLPKLAEQKEVERKLAEQADIQRQRAHGLVGANRSNVNCAVMKCIALTYDDGPHAIYGPKIMDILKERGAVATFFVLGSKVAQNAAMLQRAIAEGNEIGNHSWSHTNLTTLSALGVANEVKQTEQAIFSVTGKYSRLMRPPYGAHNTQVAAHAGLPLALWSIDTADWRNRDANVVYQRVMTTAAPGSVILMHEIHQVAVDASPRIIDELQRQGYVFVTMSELFGITGENVQQFNGQVLRHK